MASYLRLATLNLAAFGVLEVVFGKDGTHEDAPYWMGPVVDLHPGGQRGWFHVTRILSGRFANVLENAPMLDLHDAALDLRVPSVAARLAGLCERAADSETYRAHTALLISALRAPAGAWFDDDAARLAALTLALAPRIAALRPTS